MTGVILVRTEGDGCNWQGTFVEQLAAIGATVGLSRTHIRLLAWLVVCDPSYQSAPQLQAGLRLSSGSVSSGMNALVRWGLVRRFVLPGDRHRYYEIGPDGWSRLVNRQVQVLREIRRIADQAVEAAGDRADVRLCDMRRVFTECEPICAAVLKGVSF